MKLTKYPQLCFMVETADKNILVDLGNLSYDQSFADDWAMADFILITHKHGDHCYAEIIKDIGSSVYASTEVATELRI
jgi:L-ascorbate metabolism protein UlaG (beta-lactamase superfamily)